MEVNGMNVKVSEELREMMEERGIKDCDMEEVLQNAENERLYIEGDNRFLAKKRLGNFTVYVEYAAEDEIQVLNVYGHRVALKEDEEDENG